MKHFTAIAFPRFRGKVESDSSAHGVKYASICRWQFILLPLWLFFSNVLLANGQLAAGYGELSYDAPQAGTYRLPPLGMAANGIVLNESGDSQQLHDLMQGKYTLLSFMYSNCSDVNGCPLSSYVFYKLKALMQDQPQLADNLRLISLSFDPGRDTPEVMKLYGNSFSYAGKAGDWHFLTTSSEQALQPILADYKQDTQREVSMQSNGDYDYAHLLRVFLIDPALQIRNIYSVGFLHPDLIVADLETLLLEDASTLIEAPAVVGQQSSTLSRPGDSKSGYDSIAYITDTHALTKRGSAGKAADLYAIAQQPPLGLPALSAEHLQSLSPEKIELGRRLFFDRRLSLNDTFSCAMCHVPEQGFTHNEMQTAVGLEGRSVRRNSPTLYNVAYSERLFHDGREFSLEDQVWAPLLANNEMANPSIGYVLNKIRNINDYQGEFEAVYGQPLSMPLVGDALAAYQRTLLSADSPFDRWRYGSDQTALSESAKRGFGLFTGKAACAVCHQIGENNALFTDQQLHNTGIGFRASMGRKPATKRIALAPGVFVDVDQSLIDKVGEPLAKDLGLYEVTQNPSDRWKYKTPGLRNVELTAPYMHNGVFSTLDEVVEFYNQGGIPNPALSTFMFPLDLTETEQSDLVAFLKSLTGSNVDTLVADAFAAPVGDLTASDPNWANRQSEPLKGESRWRE